MAFKRGPNVIRDGLVLSLDAANNKSLFPPVEVLVVAGGGGGGSGGGGAGGLIHNSSYSVTAATTVTVGGGGVGGQYSSWSMTNGDNSVFGSLTAIGGGRGGPNDSLNGAGSGGSGGGGGSTSTTNANGGPATSGQGYSGGTVTIWNNPYPSGGGGGAGAAGQNAVSNTQSGNGGIGLSYSISGTLTYYAGGGGGAVWVDGNTHGTGGLGGGGNGALNGAYGTTNTGGGGGGGAGSGGKGGDGGSGIVIVRYKGMCVATGGVITTDGEYTVHTFLTSGTFAPITDSNTWVDLSKNGIYGTLLNGPTFNSDNMGSLSFDGTDDYVTCKDPTSLQLTAYGTISVWFYHSTDVSEAFGGLVSKTSGGSFGQQAYVICWSNAYGDKILAAINNEVQGGNNLYGSLPRFRTWCNYVFTWDGSNLILYKDGIFESTTPQLVNAQILATDVNIGRAFSNNGYCFNGRISNTSIYNRALSSDEVLQNYNALKERYTEKIVTDGLVLNLDAGKPTSYPGTGTVWTDLSGYGNNGTLTNGPTYSSANAGSLVFDGTNDYSTTPVSNSLTFGTGDFTLEVWIYPTTFTGYNHMIAMPTQNTFALKANTADGSIYFYSPTWTTFGSTTGWTLTLNVWNHVIFKRENSIGYAYLNGESKGSKTGFTNNFTSQILNIHNGIAGEFLQSRISNVKVYNRALSVSEVLQNYNALKHRFGL